MQPTTEALSWRDWHSEEIPLQLGVSSCLLGEEVRFDGGHARSRFVTDGLGPWVRWVPTCPEVEIGMGTPRPSIRLEQHGEQLRLRSPKTGVDYTRTMEDFALERVQRLLEQGIDGYVFKKNSPSCGMERVRVHGAKNLLHKKGRGLFAERLMRTAPHLPVEEDGRLGDPALRENFIERIFCRNRWRNLVADEAHRKRLIAFHTAHKLLIWSHNESAMRRMGHLLGSAPRGRDPELYARYEEEFAQALQNKPTRRRHTNVLQHAFGYLKKLLSPTEKRELLIALEDYRQGLLPLIVPITLLRYNIKRFEVDYLLGQLYFDPHPKELLLRNHA